MSVGALGFSCVSALEQPLAPGRNVLRHGKGKQQHLHPQVKPVLRLSFQHAQIENNVRIVEHLDFTSEDLERIENVIKVKA